jgi:hypothetical protein
LRKARAEKLISKQGNGYSVKAKAKAAKKTKRKSKRVA